MGISRAVRRGGTVLVTATTHWAPLPFRGQIVATLDRPLLVSLRSAMMRPHDHRTYKLVKKSHFLNEFTEGSEYLTARYVEALS